MPKSLTRQKIEKAIDSTGLSVTDKIAYTDKSQSGWRIKYCFIQASDEQLQLIRQAVRSEFPKNDVRVWNVKKAHHYGYNGVAVKVFNN